MKYPHAEGGKNESRSLLDTRAARRDLLSVGMGGEYARRIDQSEEAFHAYGEAITEQDLRWDVDSVVSGEWVDTARQNVEETHERLVFTEETMLLGLCKKLGLEARRPTKQELEGVQRASRTPLSNSSLQHALLIHGEDRHLELIVVPHGTGIDVYGFGVKEIGALYEDVAYMIAGLKQ